MIYRVSADGGASRPLCAGRTPSWSPQGDKIALTSSGDPYLGDLYLVPATGGERKKLASSVSTDDSELAWSSNGRFIAFQKVTSWTGTTGSRKGSTLFCGEACVVEAASGALRQLTRLKDAFPEDAHQLNADVRGWTRDGQEVLVGLPAGQHGSVGLYAVNAASGNLRLLYEGIGLGEQLCPDGARAVAIRYEEVSARNWSKSLVEVSLDTGEVRTIHSFTERPPWRLAVSWPLGVAIGAGPPGDGKQSTYALTRFDLRSGASRILTKSGCYEAAPAISPDGSLLAFYRHAQGKSTLCLMQADATEARVLASCQK